VAAYWVARWRRRDLLDHRWFLWFAVAAGPLAVLALESGWIATEVGRQPWTVFGVLRTVNAATDNPGLWWSYTGALLLYLGMTIGAVVVLRSMARRWRAGEEDLPSPYGPSQQDGPDAHGAAGGRTDRQEVGA
jgi:cytochrome d ubiquinol oxidase subunit I